MKLWTYGEAAQKVKADLDLQEETFITPDELVGYFNEGIHEAESEILKIDEDYFLTSSPLTIETDEELYDLPAGIYAQKVRSIIYTNGSTQYEIRRIRGASKFSILSEISEFSQNDNYRYIPVNNTPGSQSQIRLVPPSREDGEYLTVWHIRNAQRIPTAAEQGIQPTDPNTTVQINTVIDVPEFITFIIDFVKCRCLAKDSDPRFNDQVVAMEKQRKQMIDSLTQQVPDNDDTIIPDASIYWESS